MDDGILMVESWVMSATESIASDNTPLRPGVHVDGRSGLARPDQLVTFVLFIFARTNIVYHLYMLLLGRWLGSIR